MEDVRIALGSVILAVTSAISSTATAQTTPPETPMPAPPPAVAPVPTDQVSTAPDAAPRSEATGEIVVTALRRSETIQRTPAAVLALSNTALTTRGITDLRGLEAVVLSSRFIQQADSINPFIRGVGQSQGWPTFDPAVAINFNGIYVPRDATFVPTFDLARVEVLPGPQGTLYGRAAAGGAVNLIANRPSDDFGVSGTLEAGNYSLFHGSINANVPISDTLKARVSIDGLTRDGYLSNGTGSPSLVAVRGSLEWKPSPLLDAYIWGEYVRDRGSPPDLSTIPYLKKSNPWYIVPAGQPGPAPYSALVGPDGDNHGDSKVVFLGGQFDFHLSSALTLSYIPGYVSVNNDRFYTLGALTIPGFDLWFEVNHRIEQYTQEARLSGDMGALTWVAGAFWYRSNEFDAFLFPRVPTSYAPFRYLPYYVAEGYAGYASATLKVANGWRLTAGGRYSWDRKSARGATNFNAPSVAAYQADPTLGYQYRNHWSHVDWRVGLDVDVARGVLAYANVQTAYLPGSYNDDLPANATKDQLTVRPTTLLAFTGGVKSTLLDGKLILNDETYYYRYNDFQAGVFNGSDSSTTVFNAKRTQIYGTELSARYLLTPNDQFSVGVGYLHARYQDFVINAFIHGQLINLDLDGLQAYMAPDWTGTLGYRHTVNLASGARLVGQVDSFLSSSYWATFNHNPGSQQQGYTKTDASLTYYAATDRWSLGLWVKNLENQATISNTGPGGAIGTNVGFIDAPRTFGARFGFKFGG